MPALGGQGEDRPPVHVLFVHKSLPVKAALLCGIQEQDQRLARPVVTGDRDRALAEVVLEGQQLDLGGALGDGGQGGGDAGVVVVLHQVVQEEPAEEVGVGREDVGAGLDESDDFVAVVLLDDGLEELEAGLGEGDLVEEVGVGDEVEGRGAVGVGEGWVDAELDEEDGDLGQVEGDDDVEEVLAAQVGLQRKEAGDELIAGKVSLKHHFCIALLN